VVRSRLAGLRARRGTDVHLRSPAQLLQYDAIAARLARDRAGRVLDWGCGYGQVTARLRAHGLDVVAFDYRPELREPTVAPLEHAPDTEAHLSPDPVALPFADASFDSVLSCGVLEHVEDPDGSLDEVRRVLRPGGTFYVYKLPNRYSYVERAARLLGLYYHGEAAHDRVYTKTSAIGLLTRHGFRVREFRRANMLPLTAGGPGRLVYATSGALDRVPGLNVVSTTIELVAVAPG
jgi:SAM-dependent methyltransferase